jgi:predicted dehydrogenase
MDQNRRLIFYDKDGNSTEISVPDQELYSGEIEDMHSAILEGKTQYVSLEETRNHVKTVLALYQSANTKQVVYL